jgi:hypothetical protein
MNIPVYQLRLGYAPAGSERSQPCRAILGRGTRANSDQTNPAVPQYGASFQNASELPLTQRSRLTLLFGCIMKMYNYFAPIFRKRTQLPQTNPTRKSLMKTMFEYERHNHIKVRGRTLSAARWQSDGCVRDLKSPVLSQYPYRRETGPRLIPKLSSGGKVMEPSVLVRLVTARPCSLASRTILFISKQVSHSM